MGAGRRMFQYTKKLEEMGLTNRHADAVSNGLSLLHHALSHLDPEAMAAINDKGLDIIMEEFANTEGLAPVINPCKLIAMRKYGKVL